MKAVKRITKIFLALALVAGIFAGSGMEARAEESVKIELEYIYITDSGNNSLYFDTQYVSAGTTWGEFFTNYEKCYENGVISNANAGNNWEIDVQNRGYNDITECYGNTIVNFNQYSDAAYVTFRGKPSDYREAFYCFEVWQNGSIIDSGTNWQFLIPGSFAYGSDEAIAYAINNIEMHGYLAGYCNASGAIVEVTAPREPSEGLWDMYLVTITLPAGSSGGGSAQSSSSNQSNEPSVKEEPQTPENNYSVFQEATKANVDTAIAQATKAAQEAAANGTKATVNPIAIDTGVWISFKGDVYQKLQDSGLPVQITFMYKGVRYRVDIPAGADLMSLVDENGYCGFLNLMAHFGGTVL